MKKQLLVLGLTLVLCGCSSQEKELSNKNDTISLQIPNSTDESEKEVSQTVVTEYPLPEEVAAMEKLDVIEMGLYVDREQSMRNSNHLNFGTLTSDSEGNIYFTDFTENAIFMCGPEGQNKELLYEESGDYLYISNGCLYFGGVEPKERYIDSFIRVDCNTKETEVLYEKPCGEVRVLQDVVYLLTPGFSYMKLDEENGEIVELSKMEYAFLNTDGRYLFYNMATEEPRFLFERGYLLAWDTETETNYFLESKMVFPLLAGNWLSYVDPWTGSRHVLDLKTGSDTDLGYYAQRAASDGQKLYWCMQHDGSFQIMQWAGEEIQELCTVNVESERYGDARLFLTEEYLYWIYEIGIREESEWGYYRLSDGKTGRLN